MAREKEPLTFQDHPYQIYPDLAPRRMMKPFLAILKHKNVKYRWGFPFKISFSVNNTLYQATTTREMKSCFRKLNYDIPDLTGYEDPDETQQPTRPERSSNSQSSNSNREDAMKRLQSQRYSPVKRGH